MEGLNLPIVLKKTQHAGIEAERLLRKLAATSSRFHGADHDVTKRIESELQAFKERYVAVRNAHGDVRVFQLLRYKDDGMKCVVQGPILNPRSIEEEEAFVFDTNDTRRIQQGTPVVCHGLTGVSSPLNGKIGDVRGWTKESASYNVHFEDKDLGHSLIAAAHLRVLFGLPSNEE